MFEQALIGIDIFECRWIAGAGSCRALFGIGAVGVLRPQTMQNEGEVRSALRSIAMGVAEFRRPGEVKKVVVEARARWEGSVLRGGSGSARWLGGFARGEREEKREGDGEDRLLLHGRRIAE